MHKISDEFEFRPGRTTDYGVSCPWESKKFPIDLQWENGVSMLACSFLIESSSKLLITRTGIKAGSSSILGRIRYIILELLALEWRKFHTFELEYLWSQLANLDKIVCVASLRWGKGCIRFWGRLTLAHWTQVSDRCPLSYLLTTSVCHDPGSNPCPPVPRSGHYIITDILLGSRSETENFYFHCQTIN